MDEKPKTGRFHGCEPEEGDYDNMLAGYLWEADQFGFGEVESEEEEQKASRENLGRFIESCQEIEGVDVEDLQRKFLADPKLSAFNGGGAIIRECVRRCLAAGYDCYDSDTRTWVFPEPTECNSCEGCDEDGDVSECMTDALTLIAKGDETEGPTEMVQVPKAMLLRLVESYDRLASLAEIVTCGCDRDDQADPNCEVCEGQGDVAPMEGQGSEALDCPRCIEKATGMEDHRCDDEARNAIGRLL